MEYVRLPDFVYRTQEISIGAKYFSPYPYKLQSLRNVV